MLPGQFSGNGDWIATSDARTLAFQLLNPDQEMVSSRRNLAVCIKNASSDKTLASKLAAALRKLGYQTSIGKDEKDSIYKRTRIIVQNGNVANGNMMQNDLGHVGEVIPASVGDLYSKITILACDDIKLDLITMSSVDAPYVVPVTPSPIIAPMHILSKARHSSEPSASETVINDPNAQVDANALPNAPVTEVNNSEKYPESTNDPALNQLSQPAANPESDSKPSSAPSAGYSPPSGNTTPASTNPYARPTTPESVVPPTPVVPSAPVPGMQESNSVPSNSGAAPNR
jgi:hypothetical protein